MALFDFGENLRKLRERYNLSQKELGRRVGRTDSVISNYENNLKTPPLDVLTSFAAIFNVSIDYLAGFERKESITLDSLSPRQRELIYTLVDELQHKTTPARGGLSPQQSDILSRLMQEFAKK